MKATKTMLYKLELNNDELWTIKKALKEYTDGLENTNLQDYYLEGKTLLLQLEELDDDY